MLVTREPYGLVRVSTEAIAMEAAITGRRNAAWARLWPYLVGKIKSGADLRGKEGVWLHDYLIACGLFEVELEEVQTVQIPRDWAAHVLGGNDSSAGRAIRQLQEIGLLELVHKGEPNHAGLYAVMPLPTPEPNPPPPRNL